MQKATFFLFVLLCLPVGAVASFSPKPYVIFFTDKAESEYSLDRPLEFLSERSLARRVRQNIPLTVRDLPVSSEYLEAIQATGAELLYASRWLNGALIKATNKQLSEINALSFITSRPVDLGILSPAEYLKIEEDTVREMETEAMFGRAANQLNMLGVDQMHAEGFRGEGMLIAILDGGFYKANEFVAFDSLFEGDRIIDTYDFVEQEVDVFDNSRHGMQVLAAMAAYLPGEVVGPAWKASYLLFRTEDTSNESRLEEFYWLVAAERADAAGADILSSSLGYTLFDSDLDDYSTDELNGETALITMAADLAASVGMLVVSSAGNEGNDPWGKVAPPADADSVLAVGAVNALGVAANFSSRGPTIDGRIKPNVAAQGAGTVLLSSRGNVSTSNGTSFSAPLIAGLAAGIWQAFPELTNMQLLRLIEKSASQFQNPDTILGYGIPHFGRAFTIVTGLGQESPDLTLLVFPNPTENNRFYVSIPPELLGVNLKIEVYDSVGKIVHQSKEKIDRLTISFKGDDLQPGLYFIQLSSGKQTTKQKLIVK